MQTRPSSSLNLLRHHRCVTHSDANAFHAANGPRKTHRCPSSMTQRATPTPPTICVWIDSIASAFAAAERPRWGRCGRSARSAAELLCEWRSSSFRIDIDIDRSEYSIAMYMRMQIKHAHTHAGVGESGTLPRLLLFFFSSLKVDGLSRSNQDPKAPSQVFFNNGTR